MGQANGISRTSIEGSFFSSLSLPLGDELLHLGGGLGEWEPRVQW